ncbi:MAG: serine/threonine protein kinase [Myxococcales bacterium]|nr:serine/threonine protein kinase [Myxococcales bacterium]
MNSPGDDRTSTAAPPHSSVPTEQVSRAAETRVAREVDTRETRVDALGETPVASSHASAPRRRGHERPSSIGRYLVLSQLGAGAMGVVYTAYDPELDRKVAVKLLRGQANAESRARLLREAQAMAKLSHPNVVPVYDAGESEGAVFVAMDLVEGTDLRKWLSARRRAWREIVDVLIEAGRGLAAAHAVGLVHRDFKPDNVLIGVVPGGRARRVQVADFGLAKLGDDDAPPRAGAGAGEAFLRESKLEVPLTVDADIIGTPAYMSPEQFIAKRSDARSDQFAFCVTLWEALYGERPFAGVTLQELRVNVVTNQRREPESRRGAPRWLAKICNRGLQIDPDARYPSMDALLDELDRRRDTRSWLTVALGATTVTAVGVAALRSPASGERLACEDEARERAAVWDEPTREAITRAFTGTALSYAEDALRGVTSRLDAYADAWRGMYTEACEATRVRGAQSEARLELRVTCLEDNRRELVARLDMFREADEDVVRRAVDIVDDLPSVERCAEIGRLEASTRRPEDPELRARLDVAETELSRARALLEARKYKRALELLTPLDERARELGYAPLLLDAQLARAEALRGAGESQPGRALLERSLWDAIAAGYDKPLFETMTALGYQSGHEALQRELGLVWLRHAEAQLERELRAGATLSPSREASRRATLALNRGLIELSAGNLDDAQPLIEEALQRDREARPDKPARANVIGALASLHLRRGHYEESSELFARAVESVERAKGARHPDLLGPLNNLALALERQGKYREAVDALDRGLKIFADTVGAAHPNYGLVLANRGFMVYLAGDPEEAEADMDRALEIMERALGPEHGQLGNPVSLTAELKLRLGKHEAARAGFARAHALRLAAYGADNPTLALPLAGLGRVALEEGRLDEAAQQLARALELSEKTEQDPSDLGMMRFGLARALWETGDHARARELATAALADYTTAGANSRAELAEVQRWLTARPRAE